MNLEGLCALDLRTLKPNGLPWDFTKKQDRRLAIQLVKERKGKWLIGSPPCTPFSTWNTGVNSVRSDPEKGRRALREGRVHLRFVVGLYKRQLSEGRHFLHEHPQGAASWSEPCMVSLLMHPRVDSVVSHRCEYMLYSRTKDGQWMLS